MPTTLHPSGQCLFISGTEVLLRYSRRISALILILVLNESPTIFAAAVDPNETHTQHRINAPVEIQEALEIAMSHYPELSDVEIEFRYSKRMRKAVMQAQPVFWTIFRRPEKRRYLIKMRPSFEVRGKEMPIAELPEDVLVGWLGHELGHLTDYLQRDTWSMLVFGLGYISSKSFIQAAERTADTYAVERGMGKYLVATKTFILRHAGMPYKYIDKINRLYLSPEQILEMMDEAGENSPS